MPILFLFLFLLTAILFPFFGKISIDILSWRYIILFSAMIATAIIWNIYYYRGLQAEKVQEFELIVMFQPLLTILLATIFLKGERNIHIEIAAFIAAVCLIVAHINKNHLTLSRGATQLVLAVVFMSVELIIIDVLLKVLSPVALYTIRTGILLIFFYLYMRPQISRVADSNIWLIFLTSAFGVAQMVSKFYGFEKYGVIYTSLILILAPILIYIISSIWLHEKLKPRMIISALVIIGCIVYATILGK